MTLLKMYKYEESAKGTFLVAQGFKASFGGISRLNNYMLMRLGGKMRESYPYIEVFLDRILHNGRQIIDLCQKKNISVAGVIKGINAHMPIIDALASLPFSQLSSSRIYHLKSIKENHPGLETLLLRLPMLWEIADVVAYSDISLNSEAISLEALNQEALKTNKIHKVILMQDLGDLREGCYDEKEILKLANLVEYKLKGLYLSGIGTNLGCYGAVKPSKKNLNRLIQIAEAIEGHIHRTLDYISGGATSTLPLIVEDRLPKRINHLRIGEEILVHRDLPDYYHVCIDNLKKQTMVLHGQIIEIKEKPSYPIGEIFIDAFGNRPEYQDLGIRKRALVALGKQDIGNHSKLIPLLGGLFIVGSSSDHLIVDITDVNKNLEIGDSLPFGMYYAAMLHAFTNDQIRIQLV